MITFRIGALVVWRNQVVPIVNRWVHPEGTRYLIHTRNPTQGLVTDAQVTFGQLVSEINSYARYCVGDAVDVGPWSHFVQARWWSCTRGTVIYRINDRFDERRNSPRYTQEELLERITARETSSV